MLAVGEKLEWSNININAGDTLNYFFTYCVNGVDCNTDVYTYNLAPPATTAAPQLSCPVLSNFSQEVTSTENGYKILFTPNSQLPIEWIDVHYRISQNDLVNLRMHKMEDNLCYEVDKIPLQMGDTLSYSFTYCVLHTDCNTDTFTFSVPFPPTTPAPTYSCPVLTSASDQVLPAEGNPGKYLIRFNANFNQVQVDWVDIHYSINSGTNRNFRMTPLGNNIFEYHDFGDSTSLTLQESATLSYSFTYCVAMVDCNTEVKTVDLSQPQQPQQQQPQQEQPQQQQPQGR